VDYNETQIAIVTIQNWTRMVSAKRIVNEMRRHFNATLIQTTYRKNFHNRRYVSILSFSIWLQRLYRGRVGRCRYQVVNRERKSIVIQKLWRSNRCRLKFQKKKSAVTVIQCALRYRYARQLFRELRAKARDVNNIAEERDKLQVEIQNLRKAYDKACARAATAEENSKDASALDKVEDLRQEIDKLRNEVGQVNDEKESEKNRAEDAIKKTTEVLDTLEGIKNENDKLIEQDKKTFALCTKKDQELLLSMKVVKVLKEELERSSAQAQNDMNLETEIKELAKQTTSLLNENTSLKKTLVSEQEKLKYATNFSAEKDTKISTFQQEKEVLETEIERGAQLREENLNLKETLENVQMDLEAATGTFAETKKEISLCTEEIEKLKTGLSDALTEKDAYKQKSEAAKKEMEQVREGNIVLKETLEQLEQARCELKVKEVDHSLTKPVSFSIDNSSEVTKLQKQNRSLQKEIILLRGELQEGTSKSSVPYNQLEILNGEIETLRKEKESLEINMTTLSRHVAIERRASEEFDELIHDVSVAKSPDSNKGRPSSPMFSVGTESSDEQDEEVLILEAKVEHLKKELEEARSSELAKGTDMLNEVDSLRKALADSKDHSTEEILTLQDEVQYLNDELRSVKQGNGSNPMGGQRNTRQDIQFGKLIESSLGKDEEIRDLRQEIATLKDQLDSASHSIVSEFPTMSHTHNMYDDDRSVVSRLFGAPPPSIYTRSSPPHQSSNDKDYIAMKKINESLMKEVEDSKKKCAEYKKMMQDEKEHSEREIEAFGQALKGVDELRQAAEEMSREISRLKCNPQASSNIELENNSYSNPISRMQKATRVIDISALKSRQQNIWGKVAQSFAATKCIDSEDNKAVESSQKSNSRRRKRRGKRQDGDDVSIFSAFF